MVRQLQVHREVVIEGPRIYQHEGDRRNISIALGGTLKITGHTDVLVTDRAGNVVLDSKRERISADVQMVDALVPKLARSRRLRGLLESYSRAISDPENELVHLYEVRDALVEHYGNEQTARSTLGIGKTDWQRMGILANVEALEEGRHRGKHAAGRRPASSAELLEARQLVRRWITAFAETV